MNPVLDLLYFLQMLENKKNNIYKGVYSSAVNKTRDYYRMCMDDVAINSSGVDPLLKVALSTKVTIFS